MKIVSDAILPLDASEGKIVSGGNPASLKFLRAATSTGVMARATLEASSQIRKVDRMVLLVLWLTSRRATTAQPHGGR